MSGKRKAVPTESNQSSKSIMVVAAHPDDEVLGCAGTIARHSSHGDTVHIVILAEGATSRAPTRDVKASSNKLGRLRAAAEESGRILGAKTVTLLGFPDNRLDSIDLLDIAKSIESEIEKRKPHTLYVHHSGDLNIDHRIVHHAAIIATRPTTTNCVKKVLSYEVASSTEWVPPGSGAVFQPNVFVDIDEYMEAKINALKAYECEMRQWPNARSIESVINNCKMRGSQVGVRAAEAFALLREVV